MEKDLCAICRVMLQDDNRAEIKSNNFHKTCKEHKEYATVFLCDVVAENLGFKDVEEERECAVCKKILIDDEVQNSLKDNSFNFLCKKHLKKYSKMFMIHNNAQ